MTWKNLWEGSRLKVCIHLHASAEYLPNRLGSDVTMLETTVLYVALYCKNSQPLTSTSILLMHSLSFARSFSFVGILSFVFEIQIQRGVTYWLEVCEKLISDFLCNQKAMVRCELLWESVGQVFWFFLWFINWKCRIKKWMEFGNERFHLNIHLHLTTHDYKNWDT